MDELMEEGSYPGQCGLIPLVPVPNVCLIAWPVLRSPPEKNMIPGIIPSLHDRPRDPDPLPEFGITILERLECHFRRTLILADRAIGVQYP